MVDYKLLHALATVVECGGFERAGDMMGLSQSAISQRIKALEVRLGQPVLVRHPALAPTPAGQRLLAHYQQVQLLERDLHDALPSLEKAAPRLRIALNADSVVTWWADAVADICQTEEVLLDLVIEDQEVGLKRLRHGDVAACLCATPNPIAGAHCLHVGDMSYQPLASPSYATRFFPEGPSAEAFQKAPAIVFGPHDQLQHQFLAQCGYQGHFPYHLCPSSEGFVRLAMAGIGYGMIPQRQAAEQLQSGQLVSIAPGHGLTVPLYWHFWRHSGQLVKRLTERLSHLTL